MKLKTEKDEYNATAYGYGATMPDGTRTWSCEIEPIATLAALECAQDLAGGSVEIYNGELLIETVTGFTVVQRYSCTVESGAVSSIAITIQEPGIKTQLEDLAAKNDLLTSAMNEVLFDILPGISGE